VWATPARSSLSLLKPRFTNTLVRVLVGEPSAPPKEYHLHAFQLTHRSRFFSAALNGDWKEANENTIRLPEEDPSTFDLYVSLIFFGNIPIEEHYGTQLDAQALILQSGEEYRKLLDLYLLCERLQDRMAKNLLIDAVVAQSFILYTLPTPAGNATADFRAADGNENNNMDYSSPLQVYPGLGFISEIYDNTLAPNKMREVLVDMWAYNKGTMGTWMTGAEDEYNKSFLFDLAKRQGQLSRCFPTSYAWLPDSACSMGYHEHEDDVESRPTAMPVRTKDTKNQEPEVGAAGRIDESAS
jgi:hypothetical protein